MAWGHTGYRAIKAAWDPVGITSVSMKDSELSTASPAHEYSLLPSVLIYACQEPVTMFTGATTVLQTECLHWGSTGWVTNVTFSLSCSSRAPQRDCAQQNPVRTCIRPTKDEGLVALCIPQHRRLWRSASCTIKASVQFGLEQDVQQQRGACWWHCFWFPVETDPLPGSSHGLCKSFLWIHLCENK